MHRTALSPKFATWIAWIGVILAAGCGQAAPTPTAPDPKAVSDSPSEDAGLYCKEHGVPEKFCTLCHEELKGKLVACKEHGGLPEVICTLCHPEAEKKFHLEMCPNGHKLPRHFCAECNKKT